MDTFVSPRMRRVDWNIGQYSQSFSVHVSPRMRRVDWNICTIFITLLITRLSSHEESGLKFVKKVLKYINDLSLLAWGEWIEILILARLGTRMMRLSSHEESGLKYNKQNKYNYNNISPRMRRVDWNINTGTPWHKDDASLLAWGEWIEIFGILVLYK